MLIEWVLILTLSGNHMYAGPAVTSVPGFSSQKECLTAANAWIKNVSNNLYVGKAAVCVGRTKALDK